MKICIKIPEQRGGGNYLQYMPHDVVRHIIQDCIWLCNSKNVTPPWQNHQNTAESLHQLKMHWWGDHTCFNIYHHANTYKKPGLLVFMDFSKAFDLEIFNKMLSTLEVFNFPMEYICKYVLDAWKTVRTIFIWENGITQRLDHCQNFANNIGFTSGNRLPIQNNPSNTFSAILRDNQNCQSQFRVPDGPRYKIYPKDQYLKKIPELKRLVSGRSITFLKAARTLSMTDPTLSLPSPKWTLNTPSLR